MIHDVSATDESATDEGNCINAQLDQYLSEPRACREDDPVSWWKMNSHRFRYLTTLAFSTVGDVISEHCCHLLPENAETLIFLKYKTHLLDTTLGIGYWI